MRLTTGNRLLLESSTFLTFDDCPHEIELSHLGEELTLVMSFESDPESEEMTARIKPAEDDSSRARFIFTNYNDTLGAHNEPAAQLGTIGHRALWVRWEIARIGKSVRRITLSFYVDLEKPDADL